MSIRRALLAVLVLASVAFAAAMAAFGAVFLSRDTPRLEAIRASALDAAQAISAEAEANPGMGQEQLRPRFRATLAAAKELFAGVCTPDGPEVLVAPRPPPGESFGPQPPGEPRGPPPPGEPGAPRWESGPLPREGPRRPPPPLGALVEAACQTGTGPNPRQFQAASPRELHTAVVLRGKTRAVWVVAHAERQSPLDRSWLIPLGLLAAATLALFAVALSSMAAVRAGTRSLEGSLRQLEADLRSPLPRPRVRELATLAAAIESLAARLADAGEHERALQRQLSQQERLGALGRVTAGVAHEFRNPLAAIKLRLDLLERERRLDPVGTEDVRTAQAEIARLDRLVTQILGVARRGAGASVPVELRPLAARRIESARAAADARGVSLAAAGDGCALADPDLVTQALDNLIRNALEASPRGAEVTVRCSEADSAARIDVEDAGPGVAPEREAKLFEPFFTTKPDGTGLGLWLSRAAVEAAGGRLTYAREGAVTRMRIELPRRTGT